MEKYDKLLHLPQQVENLYQLNATGNIEGFDKVVVNIESIIDRNLAVQKPILNLLKLATDGINLIVGGKDVLSVEDIRQIENALRVFNSTYMDKVVELVSGHLEVSGSLSE